MLSPPPRRWWKFVYWMMLRFLEEWMSICNSLWDLPWAQMEDSMERGTESSYKLASRGPASPSCQGLGSATGKHNFWINASSWSTANYVTRHNVTFRYASHLTIAGVSLPTRRFSRFMECVGEVHRTKYISVIRARCSRNFPEYHALDTTCHMALWGISRHCDSDGESTAWKNT